MTVSSPRIRPFRLQPSYLPHAEGSCLVSMGRTQVLCVASVEDGAPPHAEEKGHGWVHAEYAMLPRAGERRTSRSKAANGGRAQEISRLIGRSLRAAVDLSRMPGHTVTIDCDVIRADGGTRTASINGGLVALAQALDFLRGEGRISHWPLLRTVAAVSVGRRGSRTVLDMDYEDDRQADADLNLVMTHEGDVVEIQGTAEGAPFCRGQLNRMIATGWVGIRAIAAEQRRHLNRWAPPSRPRAK